MASSDIVYGADSGRTIASTLGRAMSLGALTGPIALPRTLYDSYDVSKARGGRPIDRHDERAKLYERIMLAMKAADPKNLGTTRVRLGGNNYIDDIRRVWKNKRTSLLVKPLYTPIRLLTSLMTDATRSDHYDPITDTVTLYSDNPAVLTHELGHAIDFNSWSPLESKEDIKKERGLTHLRGMLRRSRRRLLHDTYSAYQQVLQHAPINLAAVQLSAEGLANVRSLDNLNKAFKDNPEALKNIKTLRTQTLPSAYSTYLMNHAVNLGVLAPFPIALPLGMAVDGAALLATGLTRAGTRALTGVKTDTAISELRKSLGLNPNHNEGISSWWPRSTRSKPKAKEGQRDKEEFDALAAVPS